MFDFFIEFFVYGIGEWFLSPFSSTTPTERLAARRRRALRRKLIRYLKSAPLTAFVPDDDRYRDSRGGTDPKCRSQALALARALDLAKAADWETLCGAFLDAMARSLPGLAVQLPPDEPRLVYAGDKQL